MNRPIENGCGGDVGDRERSEGQAGRVDEPVEELQCRCDRLGDRRQRGRVGWAAAHPAARHKAERRGLEAEERGPEGERPAIEELLDRSPRREGGRIEIVAFLAAREVTEDGIRLGEHEVAVCQCGNAADAVHRQVPVGAWKIERDRAPLVGEAELRQHEACLERVRRDGVVVEEQRHDAMLRERQYTGVPERP